MIKLEATLWGYVSVWVLLTGINDFQPDVFSVDIASTSVSGFHYVGVTASHLS
jgi:hypothetical protein